VAVEHGEIELAVAGDLFDAQPVGRARVTRRVSPNSIFWPVDCTTS